MNNHLAASEAGQGRGLAETSENLRLAAVKRQDKGSTSVHSRAHSHHTFNNVTINLLAMPFALTLHP